MTREEKDKLLEMVDQSIVQNAKIMNVSETVVRAAFDNLIKPQSYVPIQDFCKSAKCSGYKKMRKKIRRFCKRKRGIRNADSS